MNKTFLRVKDATLKSGLLQPNSSLTSEFMHATETFTTLAQTASEIEAGDDEIGDGAEQVEPARVAQRAQADISYVSFSTFCIYAKCTSSNRSLVILYTDLCMLMRSTGDLRRYGISDGAIPVYRTKAHSIHRRRHSPGSTFRTSMEHFHKPIPLPSYHDSNSPLGRSGINREIRPSTTNLYPKLHSEAKNFPLAWST